MLKSPLLASIMLALLLFCGLWLLRSLGLLQPLELLAYDQQRRMQPVLHTGAQRVALVAISEQDIQAMRQWPLSDANLAAVIQAIQGLGAAAIGVDIYRDHPVGDGRDRLSRVLLDTPQLVMAEKLGPDGRIQVPPPTGLAGTDQVGFTDLLVDPDGRVRRGLLFMDDGQQTHYSLALRLTLRYLAEQGIYPQPDSAHPDRLRLGQTSFRPLQPDDGGYIDADAAGYQFLLDFSHGVDAFDRYSLQALLSGQLTATDLGGRVVLVGVEADSVKDRVFSPLSNPDSARPGTSGLEIHAHATAQLLNSAFGEQQPMRVTSALQENGLILLLTIGAALVAFSTRRLWLLITNLLLGNLVLVLISQLQFNQGLWIPVVPAMLGWTASLLLVTAYMASVEKAQKRFLMDLFARHVSPDVAEEIWRQRDQFLQGGRLEPNRMMVTVLFADLENFTPVAEALTPEELIDWLNRYMSAMAGLVMQHGGVVDDYYGDAIKANFGVPAAHDTESAIQADALSAVYCALDMCQALQSLNDKLQQQGMPRVRIRVGISTGAVVAGCLGSAERMKYTTMGDTVNVAARLEAYGKEIDLESFSDADCRIMVADSTINYVGQTISHRHLGSLNLKGKTEPVSVYTVFSSPDA